MKIFLTVGTGLEAFDRLIEIADAALDRMHFSIGGICQFGSCKMRSRHLENHRMVSRSHFSNEMAEADAVICHGGVGAIHAALSVGHVPCVMPRRRDRGEVVNNHQLELVELLSKRELVRRFEDATTLSALLREAQRAPNRHAPGPLPAALGASLVVPPSSPRSRRERRLLELLAKAAPR